MPERTIGWDLGGAHLKAALAEGGTLMQVLQLPCPLWQGLDRLDAAIGAARSILGSATRHAVTMTGEMTDLFPNRAAGVAALVEALEQRLAGAPIRYYGGAAGWLDAAGAGRNPRAVASANWHASAAWTARRIKEGLLLDIGSTTTDVVPFRGGEVRSRGTDDASRLVTGELLYTGVVRTPVMALAEIVPFRGDQVPLMAEHFATSADVHRLCGTLPERCDQQPAADGGAKTPEASARRLARMIGRDLEDAAMEEWRELARWLGERQAQRVADACATVLVREGIAPEAPLVCAGAGRFLAPGIARRLGRPHLDFAVLAGGNEWAAVCAPAAALALLASERKK
ncbi:MAG TPA: hydantoinase/oxoprolinase family protein [Burkholderiales bacterium]|nr:hydantoinase/oxoprolinase family protein [Burkholderiales bacterium]